jgi:hypothetical protein
MTLQTKKIISVLLLFCFVGGILPYFLVNSGVSDITLDDDKLKQPDILPNEQGIVFIENPVVFPSIFSPYSSPTYNDFVHISYTGRRTRLRG